MKGFWFGVGFGGKKGNSVIFTGQGTLDVWCLIENCRCARGALRTARPTIRRSFRGYWAIHAAALQLVSLLELNL